MYLVTEEQKLEAASKHESAPLTKRIFSKMKDISIAHQNLSNLLDELEIELKAMQDVWKTNQDPDIKPINQIIDESFIKITRKYVKKRYHSLDCSLMRLHMD